MMIVKIIDELATKALLNFNLDVELNQGGGLCVFFQEDILFAKYRM